MGCPPTQTRYPPPLRPGRSPRRRIQTRLKPLRAIRRGFHEMFTSRRPQIKETWPQTPDRHGRRSPAESRNPARGDVVIKNKIGALAGVTLLALGLAACGSSSSSSSSSSSTSSGSATTISGAGSTFAAPVYEQWASSLASTVKVNYQAVGSGAGITSLESKTVDFGASDPPLKP